MQAIILAAGLGSRLRPLTSNKPKPLVKIVKQSMILHNLIALNDSPIEEVFIVTGYLGDRIQYHVNKNRNCLNNLDIVYTQNVNYAKTGTIESIKTTMEYVRGDILLIEGDIFYDSRMIEEILNTDSENVLLCVKPSGYDEVFIEADANNLLVKLSRDRKLLKSSIGQMACINKLTQDYFLELCNSDEKNYWDAMEVLAKYGLPIKCKLVEHPWIEVDTYDDLIKARLITHYQIHGIED